LQATASAIGKQVDVLTAKSTREIDAAFLALSQRPADALVITPDQLLDNRRVQLVTLVTHYRLPTIYPFRENVEIGGLMSYGSSAAERDRQVGIYTGRILKGEKPADLPVIRAAKFEFVVNLQTAKVLGLDVPATLLASADEVIDGVGQPQAGAIQPVEVRPKLRSSVRLVASVAWPLATVVAKRTQRLHGVGIEPRKIRHRRGREFSFARRQHVRHRYARC